jgi:hypothetical protein
LTQGIARELARALRTWYFDIGGLLMSEPTREAYFDLQRALKSAGDAGASGDILLPDPTTAALKQLGSRLRTATTDDVATRVGPLLTHSLRAWLGRGRRWPRVTVTRAWSCKDPPKRRGRVACESRQPLVLTRADGYESLASRYSQQEDRRAAVGSVAKAPQVAVPARGVAGVRDGPRMEDGPRYEPVPGPHWRARSRSGSDAPASPIPRDTKPDGGSGLADGFGLHVHP